jgi:hypothetical protein
VKLDHLLEGAICTQLDDGHFEDIVFFEGLRVLVDIFGGELDRLIDCFYSLVFDKEQ